MQVDQKRAVTIIQFAKWPIKGHVKTRLAKTLGDDAALLAHQRLTLSVLSNVVQSHLGVVELWFDQLLASSGPGFVRDTMIENEINLCEQQGADLGARMAHALISRLTDSENVILVGSDCPAVDSAYLASAIAALNDHDVVLGPAEDGGYVLIGLAQSACHKLPLLSGFLSGIDWGQSMVLAQTITHLESLKLSYQLLEVLWDVDDEQDWNRFITLG